MGLGRRRRESRARIRIRARAKAATMATMATQQQLERLKAVFFGKWRRTNSVTSEHRTLTGYNEQLERLDMDDTLVLTSECDKFAYVDVRQLAKELLPQVVEESLISAFRRGMASTPWDKEHKIHVDEWRAGLWNNALTEQDIPSNMEVARQLQAKYRTVRLDHFKFLSGSEDMIKRMKAKGLEVVIITNGHHEVQRQKLVACDAEELFGANIIVGGEEVLKGEQEKPHQSIFQKACALAKCTCGEAIHVGDSLKTDIQGGINAKLAGTIWINASKKELPSGAPAPTFIVEKVTEVEKIIESFSQ